ncbi:Flp family type IVb pilin [Devosia sp.]|uniref:Flp family type IVb pilin n=1 Tax=Devosia sp. TaxID=1871048 RepID=UPI003A94F740
MVVLSEKFLAFGSNEDGATAIEYGLIAAMIAVGILVTLTAFGGNLAGLFNNVADKTQNAMGN